MPRLGQSIGIIGDADAEEGPAHADIVAHLGDLVDIGQVRQRAGIGRLQQAEGLGLILRAVVEAGDVDLGTVLLGLDLGDRRHGDAGQIGHLDVVLLLEVRKDLLHEVILDVAGIAGQHDVVGRAGGRRRQSDGGKSGAEGNGPAANC